jgi:hypothetical protein
MGLRPLILQLGIEWPQQSLGGSFVWPEAPTWSVDGFTSGQFQKDADAYVRTQLGLYPTLVRIYNEWRWSVARQSNPGLWAGPGSVVFEESYLKTALGDDFKGLDSIQSRVQLLQKVSDTLAQNGIALVVAIAPGKAVMMPDHWPQTWKRRPPGETNLSAYNKELKKSNLNYISLYDWLLKVKDTLSYPLYPTYGIHLSRRAEFFVADTLVKALSAAMETNLPTLTRGALRQAAFSEGRDYDVAQAMNLLFPRIMKLGFVEYRYHREGADTNAKVLVVADSYYWEMFNNGLSAKAFNGGSFWYYNAVAYPESYNNHLEVKSLDLKQALKAYAGILLFTTDANLKKMGFDFPERVAEAYGITGQ